MYKRQIKNSFQHAENFLVERDGSLRNRPASNPLGVPTLPSDEVLLFDFRGQAYTIVYDPLYVMEFESTSSITGEDLVNVPGPDISLGTGKSVNATHTPNDTDFWDRAFRADDVFGYDQEYPTIPDPIPNPIPQSFLTTLRAWADTDAGFDPTDDDDLYDLYLRLYMFRAKTFSESMHWLSLDKDAWDSVTFSSTDTSTQLLDKIRGYVNKVTISGHSLYWNRFLIYGPDGNMLHNGIVRCVPDGATSRGETPSGTQRTIPLWSIFPSGPYMRNLFQ